jgi:hypothetical protein
MTLWDVEESLSALLDTAELVPVAAEECFLLELEQALTTAADKRDRVAGMLAYLETRQSHCEIEIARLQNLKKASAAAAERLEGYITYVITRMGKDAKGKYRKLEGHTSTLSLAACPVSVEITDPLAVPLDYQTVTVTMPASMWADVLNAAPWVQRTVTVQPDKVAIKATIQAGVDVLGAKLVTDKTSVRRK